MKKEIYIRGEVCPTCLQHISVSSRVEFNPKTGVTRHASCAELRPMQKKAIAELDRVMSNIKLKKNSFYSMKIRGI